MSGNDPKQLRYPADWLQRKNGPPIAVVTAYDATMAGLAVMGNVDALLVGDSLAMVVQGRKSTLSVTLDEMLYHSRLVRRGAPDTFLIGDMPFGSYHASVEQCIQSGTRFFKESDVDAIKLEGTSKETLIAIERMVNSGMPVMGHIGLTPQSYLNTGGFRVQGRSSEDAQRIRQQARDLQNAGCFSFVLELCVADLAETITREVDIPTIGIGAGRGTSGQVLVLNDLIGLDPGFQAKHVRRFAELGPGITHAVNDYVQAVRSRTFPGDEQSFR